ncbi:hypothetical protein L9F63_020375, partial [Diploptera punctata]
TTCMLFCIKIYNLWIKTPCTCKTRMDGKTVIVTGSNTGIGKETARDLARRGARVILACRNLEKAKEARDDIIKTTGNKNVEIRELDLSSLLSVRTFAKDIIESEPRLDVLINNAGLGERNRILTADNFEMTFQVNHLGPFLLTCLLLDLMKKSAPSRIIMVSSYLHHLARVDFNNLQSEKWHFWLQQYAITKLGNILMAKELTKKLKATVSTAMCCLHRVICTDIWEKLKQLSSLVYVLIMFSVKIFCKDAVEGSQTSIHLAVSEELKDVSGKHFWECKETTPSKAARNEALAQKFWERSEALVDLRPEEKFY